MFNRQCIVEMKTARTASASLIRVAVLHDFLGPGRSPLKLAFAIVAPCGNRQRFPYGDHYEQRAYRSPASDQTPTGGPVSRRHLSHLGTHPGLVPHLVAALSSPGPQWAARTHARQCATASDCPRPGAEHLDHSSAPRFADPSRHALQPHWGQYDFSRTAGLAYWAAAQPAHPRASPRTQWGDRAACALGALLVQQHLSRPPSRRDQPTP